MLSGMNRRFICLWLAVVGVLVPALGQGTVNLNNNFTPPGAASIAFVLGEDGLPLSKEFGRVEVLDANWRRFFPAETEAGWPFFAAGRFTKSDLEIPNTVPGGTAVIVIRAWDRRTGTSFGNASSKRHAFVTITNLGDGDGLPNASLAFNSDFRGIQLGSPITPEPPTKLTITTNEDGQYRIRTGFGSWPRVWYGLKTTSNLTNWTVVEWKPGSDGPLEWLVATNAAAGYFSVESWYMR